MQNFTLRLGKSLGCFNDDFFDDLQKAKDLGFDTIDFDVSGFWRFGEGDEHKIKSRLEEAIDAVLKIGITVNGVHIPYGWDWDLSDLDPKILAIAMHKIKVVINSTSVLSPRCYILHGSFEPIDPLTRADRLDTLKKSVATISAFTDKTICLEVLPRTCLLNTSNEIIEVVDAIGLPNVKVCVDVNHFLQEKSEDGVLNIGNRIFTTHISDHDYVNERHWLPGKGKIDWLKLIANLEKIGYNGVFNYELEVDLPTVKQNYIALFDAYNKSKGV
jgi:sugar phosphate isomerase/epimerase